MNDHVVSTHTAWVLVIEDLRDQAELWSDICANAGLNSTTVATGIGGYRRACEIRPAIILLDLMLPDVDGWEVCRQLNRSLRVRTAVHEGVFDDPKTTASLRTIPLPDAALELLTAWKARATRTTAQELTFSTVSGKPISPNNVLRRWVWPACQAADLQRVTWLTFRRTYSSWARDKGVPAKVVAQIMGHTKVDTTMNVYTQVLDGAARSAADRVGSELFRVVQIPDGATTPTH